jgi:hypothetical protein
MWIVVVRFVLENGSLLWQQLAMCRHQHMACFASLARAALSMTVTDVLLLLTLHSLGAAALTCVPYVVFTLALIAGCT